LRPTIHSAVLRKETRTVEALARALVNDDELVLCPVVFYEIQRGLRSRDAHKQLAFFERYARALTWEELDRGDWEAAADSWARLRARGCPIEDADLLIGTYSPPLSFKKKCLY
jgi:predicted nucleic acid-binding protein